MSGTTVQGPRGRRRPACDQPIAATGSSRAPPDHNRSSSGLVGSPEASWRSCSRMPPRRSWSRRLRKVRDSHIKITRSSQATRSSGSTGGSSHAGASCGRLQEPSSGTLKRGIAYVAYAKATGRRCGYVFPTTRGPIEFFASFPSSDGSTCGTRVECAHYDYQVSRQVPGEKLLPERSTGGRRCHVDQAA